MSMERNASNVFVKYTSAENNHRNTSLTAENCLNMRFAACLCLCSSTVHLCTCVSPDVELGRHWL